MPNLSGSNDYQRITANAEASAKRLKTIAERINKVEVAHGGKSMHAPKTIGDGDNDGSSSWNTVKQPKDSGRRGTKKGK